MNFDDRKQQVQYFIVERRLLVVAITIAASSVLLAGFGIWPTWQKIQMNTKAIKRLEQQVSKSSQRVSILNALTETDKKNFERVAIALPEYKQPLNNLMTINLIASRSGVVIDDYNLNPGIVSTDSAQQAVSTAAVAKASESFEFEVTLTGSLEQIEDAFSQIETSLPLMDISEFDLNSSAKVPGQFQITLSLLSRYSSISSASVAKQTVAKLSSDQEAVIKAIQEYTLPGEGSDILPHQYNNQSLFKEE